MGLFHSRPAETVPESDVDRALRAASLAVKARDADRLQTALRVVQLDSVRRQSSNGCSDSDSTTQTHRRRLGLLERAVFENFVAGVDIILKVRLRLPPSHSHIPVPF